MNRNSGASVGRLQNKVAVITGAANGMGAAMVRRFVAEGARVFAVDIDASLGNTLARDTGCTFLEMDVTQESAWRETLEKVERDAGRLDVLVNNAGIIAHHTIEDVELDAWHRIIGVNLTGVMLGCKHGLAAMIRNPGGTGGSIINIASSTAFAAHPSAVAYTASKGGVRMLTRAVAVHAGRKGYNVRCNTIAPGVILTAMTAKGFAYNPQLRAQFEQASPMKKIGDGDDIATAAVFLASDESKFVTGTDISVDGGVLAGHPGL